MAIAFLTVKNDAIIATPFRGEASEMFGYVSPDKYKYRLTSDDELNAFVKKCNIDSFMCSSSLDFPREYTEDERIVKLAERIRG